MKITPNCPVLYISMYHAHVRWDQWITTIVLNFILGLLANWKIPPRSCCATRVEVMSLWFSYMMATWHKTPYSRIKEKRAYCTRTLAVKECNHSHTTADGALTLGRLNDEYPHVLEYCCTFVRVGA